MEVSPSVSLTSRGGDKLRVGVCSFFTHRCVGGTVKLSLTLLFGIVLFWISLRRKEKGSGHFVKGEKGLGQIGLFLKLGCCNARLGIVLGLAEKFNWILDQNLSPNLVKFYGQYPNKMN